MSMHWPIFCTILTLYRKTEDLFKINIFYPDEEAYDNRNLARRLNCLVNSRAVDFQTNDNFTDMHGR